MAFDQTTRNKLQKFVTEARKLLVEEFTRQLQNDYGLDPVSGLVSDIEKLPHLDDSKKETARILRDTLEHYNAYTQKPNNIDTLNRIVREQAFTILNRLCAVRMAESRGIIIDSISNGYNSKGFALYHKLAGTSLGEIGNVYKFYLLSLFDELSVDLAVLFDRYSPMGRLFPKEKILLDLINKINDPEISDLWAKDETIGWIYQYFNSKEERQQMRSESQAPRNSRELAVRNQFFTPRYVVEFLTDNTLGRIWYEMNQGNTNINDFCKYLVRRPNEIFLEENKQAPEQEETTANLSQEELLKQPVYIPYRRLKDPRDIKMLDPACGSMHFGLYAFDLFEKIYQEAWEIETIQLTKAFTGELNQKPLTESYRDKEAFIRDIPRLIIENNIHGIDIDPRATQIAGLSLWLRAHRTWNDQKVNLADRPKIHKSNIVCAEPMPGEEDLLKKFTEKLKPTVLGQLVEVIFDKMKLAGEAGSLLKIEEEIKGAVEQAREEFNRSILRYESDKQQKLFIEMLEPEQKSLFNFDDLPTETQFWENAEEKILNALKDYAELAENGNSMRRRLFAQDAAKGFAFINLCRKRYDVVLMNPPFGKVSAKSEKYIKNTYPDNWKDLYAAFIERCLTDLAQKGFTGCISSSQFLYTKQMLGLRKSILDTNSLSIFIQLGLGVLDDATVETGLSIFANNHGNHFKTFYLDLMNTELSLKEIDIFDSVKNPSKFTFYDLSVFKKIATRPFAFHSSPKLLEFWKKWSTIQPKLGVVATGNHTFDDFRFLRLNTEISYQIKHTGIWKYFDKGGEYQPFYSATNLILNWDKEGKALRDLNISKYGSDAQVMQSSKYWYRKGLCYTHVSSVSFGPRVLPANCIFSSESISIFFENENYYLPLLALITSTIVQDLIWVFGRYRKIENRAVSNLPVPLKLIDKNQNELINLALAGINNLQTIESLDELSPVFRLPDKLYKRQNQSFNRNLLVENMKSLCDRIDIISELIFLGVNNKWIEGDAKKRNNLVSYYILRDRFNSKIEESDSISFYLGASVGLWDIRYVTGEKEPPALPDPFDPLPVCPLGMLQNTEGLPAEPKDVPDDYPINIPWDGILVDAPGHEKDIIARVRKAIEVIWQDKAGDIEQEACQILGVNSLRDYFSKPASFFADHLKRYSKSRRQAPIYWSLSTESGSYTLWIYYHRLNDQTLYTCVNNFVEPKIRETGDQIHALSSKDKRTSQEEKEYEKLLNLDKELKEFRDELLRIAQFWKPNLNDGVQITAAPLYRFFKLSAWSNKLKETWQQLEKGEYDWAHLAYSIWPERVVKASHKDRSIAIAHDLENELWEEIPDKRDKQGKVISTKWVPKKLSENALKNLVKPGVEAILK